jgi:putative Mn2+ efflux pump MntP
VSLLNLVVVALGVSADAFAVALTQGVRARRALQRQALTIALVFGLFQAGMPVVGWLVGSTLADLIAPVDHWIAFVLLVAIGAKMLWEAVRPGDDEAADAARLPVRELLALAVATSIDALAVGLSLAFLDVPIAPAAALIGVVTAMLTYAGVLLGHRLGTRFQTPAEVVGGVVLIGIGTKILIEHLIA